MQRMTRFNMWSNPAALEELMITVREELLQMARKAFRQERRNHTLQPTALVHELYLRFQGQRQVAWRSRAQFFAVAARLMRRILVDHARKHGADKRGGGLARVAFDEAAGLPRALAPEVLALDGALLDLERRSPRGARIVEMRVLVGLTLEEIAAVEGVSLSTASREWRAARLFLLRQLEGGGRESNCRMPD